MPFSLFDLLSLFYVFIGLRAIWTLIKNWHAFTDDKLTAFDRQLASQIAFFVFIPIGVFFHELGHAAATYQVGGTIDWLGGGFHYALFWGYVVPLGRFTPLEDWWIALSGNLVSVIYGFLPLIFLRFTNKAWIKYTILSFARIQLGWSLVGYPLLTFAGFEGDWTTIYFTSLFLSIPLFVIHASLVAALWLFDRSTFVRRWEVGLYAGVGAQIRALDATIAARPGAVEPIITRGNFFASQNHIDLAIADYRAALKIDPQNSRALYNIGQLRLIQKRYTDAEKNFRAALARVESDPQLAARVHYGLGFCLYHHGGAAKALPEFDAAIARMPDVPEFYFWRGTARHATRDDANARNDFARAAQLAATTNPELAARAREMLVNGKQ
ncbi:MAG: tetratricopeptide repeat protein [Chloroflexota bacterium]|nr:tetratricopeptide repeat protein [Chloroflexota bacterium]